MWRVHALGGITVTETDAGSVVVPPKPKMRPMRPAYNIGKGGDDEWVIGGESNYRPEIPAQCSIFQHW